MQPLQQRAERALDALSFFVSDARYGLGAYLSVYLMTEHAWDAASIGAALSIGAMTGLVSQAPLGALVDAVRASARSSRAPSCS
jgi:sugar phosphate permease